MACQCETEAKSTAYHLTEEFVLIELCSDKNDKQLLEPLDTESARHYKRKRRIYQQGFQAQAADAEVELDKRTSSTSL